MFEGANFLAIHDFDDYQSFDDIKHVLELPNFAVLHQSQEVSDFFHEFHAEDYRPPPLLVPNFNPLSCGQQESTIRRRMVAPT